MIHKVVSCVALAVLAACFMLVEPAGTAAQKIVSPQPTVIATSVKLLASGCGAETHCVQVNWNVIAPPANPQVMSFEVHGKLFTDRGSCESSAIISDPNARRAKLGFFQQGACTGTVKAAAMTVKLFTRDLEGQKALTSTSTKTQSF